MAVLCVTSLATARKERQTGAKSCKAGKVAWRSSDHSFSLNEEPPVPTNPTAASSAMTCPCPEASAADFCWMVDAGASVTGSLQFAKLCSIYLTPCSGGL
jgi:hypothetical protein